MSEPSELPELITVCRSTRLTHAAYRFYRAIMLAFSEYGGPPDQQLLHKLAARFGLPVAETLADLAVKGLLQRDPATGAIHAAYPFSGQPTAHRVTLAATQTATSDHASRHVFAMCALDALGIPLMLQRDAQIASQDTLTGESVKVRIRMVDTSVRTDITRWEAQWLPAGTVVYARAPEHEHEHDCGVDASSTCCPVTNFFTTEAHAHAWAHTHPVADGVIMTADEALSRADALFGGVLDRLADDANPQHPEQSQRAASPIAVLYFAGCPNFEQAVAVLLRALDSEGIRAAIQLVPVETDGEARRLGFYGSPSIHLGGCDIIPAPEGMQPGLSCRMYHTPGGRLAPAPSYEMVVEALQQWRKTSQETDIPMQQPR
jgi:Alkylmercury lyase